MSVAEKRELVHEMSKNPHLAFEVMHEWSRQEILQILSAESGKERKYIGFTKSKIISILLKIISEKTPEIERKYSSSSTERNTENENKIISPTNQKSKRQKNTYVTKGKNITTYCKNLACQARLREEDLFCKRCSCCICYKYDDNKDTSFWLTCNSDAPFSDESCGFACHIDCAFKSDSSCHLEGCFYCVSCGKPNSFLECLKKQLMNATETRRVEELCHRLVLAQKLLKSTKKYIKVFREVEKAVKILETDLGCPLTSIPEDMHSRLVNRLDSATEVKKFCFSALRSLEKTPLDYLHLPSKRLGSMEIMSEKEVQEKSRKTSEPDRETNADAALKDPENLPNTLFRSDQINERQERAENAANEDNSRSCGLGFRYYMKTIRKLECLGHLERDFRQKFFTWYCLKATAQKINIVNAFIDTLKDDSEALASQLVDSFPEFISGSRSTIGTSGATPVVSD